MGKFSLPIFLIIAYWLLLAGCARLPERNTADMLALWAEHQPRLNGLRNWRLRGGLAVNSRDEGWDARMYWRQQGDSYQLRFSAPLGQGAMLLRGDPDGVVMRTAEGETRHAANPESLLREVAEVSVPLEALYYWVRGLPVPERESEQLLLTPDGYLRYLRQFGWEIDYARHRRVDGLRLPEKLVLKNSDWIVKLVISDWSLPDETSAY